MTITTKFEVGQTLDTSHDGGAARFTIERIQISLGPDGEPAILYEGTLRQHGTGRHGEVIPFVEGRTYYFKEEAL